MNTITFDKQKCAEVESAVMLEFDCKYHDLVGFPDTFEKKVVVFLLSKFYDFDKRNLGTAYQMTYLFVPTVVEQLEFQLLTDFRFRARIAIILNSLKYESKEKVCSA
jgi:hypothetical protein